jgi:hypothetical protein
MSKGAAATKGFLVGAVVTVTIQFVGIEILFRYQCANEPPSDDFHCLGPGLERDFSRLIGTPLAVLFGGGAGCWLNLVRRQPDPL